MEVGFVYGVVFVEQSSMEDSAIGIFLYVTDESLFEVLSLEEDIVIEESLGVRDHLGRLLLFNQHFFLF